MGFKMNYFELNLLMTFIGDMAAINTSFANAWIERFKEKFSKIKIKKKVILEVREVEKQSLLDRKRRKLEKERKIRLESSL